MSSHRLYSGFPNSWFCVASSKELPPGKVMPLHFFGKDFVLFRTEDGTPHILDAYCPHLGAHLGYGGTVSGKTIRCPYHCWTFNGDGDCVDVPHPSKLPPKTKIHKWPVSEVNGLIMMYYHAEKELPDWEMPELPEFTPKEWSPLSLVHRWKIRTNIQDYMENSVDIAHLSAVHRQVWNSAESNLVEVDGPIFIHHMSQKYNLSSFAFGIFDKEAPGFVETTYYGPGCEMSFYRIKAKVELQLLNLILATPIDKDYLDIRIIFSIKKVFNQPLTRLFAAGQSKDMKKTFEQDIDILENKAYIRNPPLYQSDGPILQCRRWMSHFYSSELPTIANIPVRQ